MFREIEALIEFINEKVKTDWIFPPRFIRIEPHSRQLYNCWEGLTEDEMRVNLEMGLASLTHKELQHLVESMSRQMTNHIERVPPEFQDADFPSLSILEDRIPNIVDILIAFGKSFKDYRAMGYEFKNQVIALVVLIPLGLIYETRYKNDIAYIEYFIRRLPPIQRKNRDLTEEVLLKDYVFDKIRDHWKVSPEYGYLKYNFWRRLSPEDIRVNLEEGIRNTCDSNDLEILVLMLNSHIKIRRFDIPKLDKKEQDVRKIVSKIMELEGLNEEYIRDAIKGDLCAIYEEKYRQDAELKALADEKLPNRDGVRIPF